MANLAVPYARPNLALQTLLAEVRARYGAPARAEYVTGYKALDNLTGHNADANGIVHAVDLFVGGPGNLTPDQAEELCGLLLAEGPRGYIQGHPDRLSYIIHNRRIAGDFSGWAWTPYGGASPHTDHVHVSTLDIYWGDPAPIGPADYDSTAPWGIAQAITVQGASVAPLEPEPMTEDQRFFVQELGIPLPID